MRCGDTARALAHDGAVDLSPPPSCRFNSAYEASRRKANSEYPGGFSLPDDIPFDDLVGSTADATTLFTCERHHDATSIRRPRRFSHVASRGDSAAPLRPLSMRDIAIGLPVRWQWLFALNNSQLGPRRSAGYFSDLCTRAGEGLACARGTWMSGAGRDLDVLMLADCKSLCSPKHQQGFSPATTAALKLADTEQRCKQSRQVWRDGLQPAFHGDSTPFSFPMKAWLTDGWRTNRSARVHAHC